MDAYSLRKPLQLYRGPRSPPKASRPSSEKHIHRLDKRNWRHKEAITVRNQLSETLAPQGDVYGSNT